MNDYSVDLTVQLDRYPDEPATVTLTNELIEHGASIGVGQEMQVMVSVDAASVPVSADLAIRWVTEACAKAGLGITDIPAVTVLTGDRLEKLLTEPVNPQLVGVSEIATKLGVSRQRVMQLRLRADFPRPIADLAAGPVWREADLSRFEADWSRKPGRPSAMPAVAVGNYSDRMVGAGGGLTDARAALEQAAECAKT